MISKQQLFPQFGAGREIFWTNPDVWLAILRALNRHDGQPYSPSANEALFSEIEDSLDELGQKIQVRSDGEDRRSVFRAAPGPWSNLGVVNFTTNGIEVTDKGRSVLAGEKSFSDCLVDMIPEYRSGNGKNPFKPVLELFLDNETHEFDEIFRSIQAEIGPGMQDWIGATEIQGFPFKVLPNDATVAPRSAQLVLKLMVLAGILEQGSTRSAWLPRHTENIEALLERAGGHARTTDSLETTELHRLLSAEGWDFEPWQIAAYCNAVRTKPFVILAGISGTGKTKLPRLVAEHTGAEYRIIPVKPEWRDSSDLIGFNDLAGRFHPGPLLIAARDASLRPNKQFFVLLDEMNLARVEYYFAEILSLMEERRLHQDGVFRTDSLLPESLAVSPDDEDGPISWKDVHLPSNLCVVGTANIDESTHPFSRKVLDRAFVLEFSTVNLELPSTSDDALPEIPLLSSSAWQPVAVRLAEHPDAGAGEVERVVRELTSVNTVLKSAQLQVGYRVRDEVAMFVLASRHDDGMRTTDRVPVDALDLAICMKVLPRIMGGSDAIERVLMALEDWAGPGSSPRMPMCHERIRLLRDRFETEGFTSFWV